MQRLDCSSTVLHCRLAGTIGFLLSFATELYVDVIARFEGGRVSSQAGLAVPAGRTGLESS